MLMAKNVEKLIFGGLNEKHAVQRGIWVPTQHSLWDQGKPWKTLIELACERGEDFSHRRLSYPGGRKNDHKLVSGMPAPQFGDESS
jgi:hypothetical protein